MFRGAILESNAQRTTHQSAERRGREGSLAALKFGGGNMKNRRFQLGLVRFLPGFYRNTHREPLNTITKGFGLEPQRSTGLVFGLKSDSRQYQLVELRCRTRV